MHKGYVIKRILYTIFIFFIVVTLNFFIPRIGVEDPAQRYYPPQGNMSDIEYDIVKQLTREQYGFDVSTFQQYLRYLGDLIHGDLGTSYHAGSPKVADLIAVHRPGAGAAHRLLRGLEAGAAGRHHGAQRLHHHHCPARLFHRAAVIAVPRV